VCSPEASDAGKLTKIPSEVVIFGNTPVSPSSNIFKQFFQHAIQLSFEISKLFTLEARSEIALLHPTVVGPVTT
jgi:hypothetical protein